MRARALLTCPHMEVSCRSPCACGIIHKAVPLRYTSIKHHLHPAAARAVRKMGWEREDSGIKRGEERMKDIEGERNGYVWCNG